MKKKIVAILATIAAVFGFGFASSTAMAADEYGSEVTSTTITFTGLTPGEQYRVKYDDAQFSSVTPAAEKISDPATANEKGEASFKYVWAAGAKAGDKVTVTLIDAADNVVTSKTIEAPKGLGAGKNDLPETGAAIAPYGVAVVLMAAAAVALLAVRKKATR